MLLKVRKMNCYFTCQKVISLKRAILRRKKLHWPQRLMVLQWFYSPRAVETPYNQTYGTSAPPSALLVFIARQHTDARY